MHRGRREYRARHTAPCLLIAGGGGGGGVKSVKNLQSAARAAAPLIR